MLHLKLWMIPAFDGVIIKMRNIYLNLKIG